jgi:iron(III) transport system substrate-binding protein
MHQILKMRLKLLEFLLTEEAQSHIVKNTFEYPIIDNVEPSEIIKSMGPFKQDLSTPVEDYAKVSNCIA